MIAPQPVNGLESAYVNDSYDKLVHPHTVCKISILRCQNRVSNWHPDKRIWYKSMMNSECENLVTAD